MSCALTQEKMLQFACASGLVKDRFVTITAGVVAYAAAGAKADGITISDEEGLKIEVMPLASLYMSFKFDALGTIAAHGEVQVGANGTGVPQTTGAIVCYAMGACVSGSIGVGYNIESSPAGASGAPETGVTAVEEGNEFSHRTTLTVANTVVLPAIAGGADLGVGVLVYTLPAGAINIYGAYMSMALDEADGNITADTPDVGVGTVIATGAVNVLGGTSTFEDIITGRAAADCNGTATVDAVADQPLAIAPSEAHTVYFNAADDWAASGEANCPVLGTIVLHWTKLA